MTYDEILDLIERLKVDMYSGPRLDLAEAQTVIRALSVYLHIKATMERLK